MRKCRYCDGPIEDAAIVCPHCKRDLFPGRAAVPVPLPHAEIEHAAAATTIARVSVVDINMPFASMVGFMIKWAIAAIPAIIILSFLAFLLAAVFALFAGGHR